MMCDVLIMIIQRVLLVILGGKCMQDIGKTERRVSILKKMIILLLYYTIKRTFSVIIMLE